MPNGGSREAQIEMKNHLLQPFARVGLMAVLLLSCVLGARAEEGVILSLKDGTEVAFALSSKPRFAMGEELTVTAPDGTNVVYAFADVRNVRFGEFTITGIDSAPGTENTPDVAFRISGGQLHVFGLPQGESVNIYDLAGRRVAMQKQTTDGSTLSISLNATGVLVVRTSTGISYRVAIP